MTTSPCVILIAEDNPTDVMIMREALEEAPHGTLQNNAPA